MQHVLQRYFRAGVAVSGQDLRKLPDALLIGAFGPSHEEMIAAHHHIAAFQRTGRCDMFNPLLRVEEADGFLKGNGFPISGCRAGIGDDGAPPGQHRRIFHKAGVREIFISRKHRHPDAALRQGFDIAVVLFQRQLIIRPAGIQPRRDAFHQPSARAAHDHIVKLFHNFLCSALHLS